MKVLRVHEYEGYKIFVVHHRALFQYWFSMDGEMFMQWGVHNPKWYRFILALFGKPLIEQGEMQSIVEAYQEHAVRSIDHIIDPDATHCPHNVVITGKMAAICAQCGKEKAEAKTEEKEPLK